MKESKLKEIETRALLGPRIGHAPPGGHKTTAPSKPGGPRVRHSGSGRRDHPTRDMP